MGRIPEHWGRSMDLWAKGTLSFVFFSSLRFLNFGCAGSLLGMHVGFLWAAMSGGYSLL